MRRAAFKIIRQKEIGKAGKPHEVMRKVHKILKKDHIKNKWLNIGDEGKIPSQLKPEEEVDDEGNSLTAAKIDEVWSSHGQMLLALRSKLMMI